MHAALVSTSTYNYNYYIDVHLYIDVDLYIDVHYISTSIYNYIDVDIHYFDVHLCIDTDIYYYANFDTNGAPYSLAQ